MKPEILKSLLICLALLTGACSEKAANLETDEVVAMVGDQPIGHNEFLLDFALNPGFRNNSTVKEARLSHLEQMRREIIMQMAASSEGLDTTAIILDRLDYIKRKEMLKALYQKEILDKLPISDAEAWEEYKRSNIDVKLRHLFAEDLQTAMALQKDLQSGESFESLAPKVFQDSVLSANGGQLGFVAISDLDPLLADSVYTLRVGIPSAPLKSSHGYHIMQVDDIRQSVFLSREFFEANQSNYVNALRRRRAEAKSREFLAETLHGKSVTIKQAILNQLLEVSQGQIRVRRSETPMPTPSVSDSELGRIVANADNLLDEPLIIFERQSWTVADFLRRLKEMPPLQRPVINRREALIRNLIDMARDEFLLQDARQQGLADAPAVRKALATWKKKVLASEFEKRLLLVSVQQQDSAAWAARKQTYRRLLASTPLTIDTSALFQDVDAESLEKRIPKIQLILRDRYNW